MIDTGSEASERPAALTFDDLRAYSQEVTGNAGFGERIGQLLLRESRYIPSQVTPYMYTDETGNVTGIAADQVAPLLEAVESGTIQLRGFAQKAQEFLQGAARQVLEELI